MPGRGVEKGAVGCGNGFAGATGATGAAGAGVGSGAGVGATGVGAVGATGAMGVGCGWGAGVETGVLPRGVGVQVPALRLDGRRDLLGITSRRPLEEHVLQEVARPVQLTRLVAGTHRDEEADVEGPRPGSLLGDDTQPMGQGAAAKEGLHGS